MLAKIGDLWGGSGAREGSDEPGSNGPPARRSNRRIAWRATAACVSAVAVVSAAACSSSSSASGSSSPSGSSSTSSSSPGSAGSSGTAQGANVAAATAALAPYTGHPSAFPVTEPLPEKLPAGKKFVFLQCGTPFCALAGMSLQEAVVAIGGKFTKLNAGTTASSAQAAAASALALKPDVVFMTVDPSLFGDGLKKLSAAGVKVVSVSIAKDVTPYGVTFNYIGANEVDNDGKLLADWVIARKGAKANAVFYGLPIFDFSNPLQQAFVNEMKKECPSCTVRTVPIDASTIGTTAPNTVVSDLQAHPATNVAVFVSLQIAQGLPAAMRAAGLTGITTVGRGPTPGNLQDIKNGGLTAGLAIDAPVSTWTEVDAAARLLEGAQPTASEKAGDLDEQFLGQKDITFNATDGWIGYPDFTQRYATLWHTGG
jgi:ribose transport system substrate-binding protein